MATGWETFGNVLGGGIDRAGAFEQGRLRTAQTESALGLARQRQLENVSLEAKNRAQEQLRESLAKSGMLPPEQVDLAANVTLGELGSDFNSTMSGLETGQEMNFRKTLADPAAGNGMRFLAGQGVQGKVLNPYEVQGNMVNDVRRPDEAPVPTDLGEAMIGSNEALTNLRNVQAGDPDYTTVSGSGGAGPGGLKPPAGFILNPAYDPAKPVGDGNFPYVDARQPVMGARESVFFNRIVGGAKNAQETIKNIVALPVGASAGVFGIGSKPGDNMFTAGVDTLRNKVSSQDVQTYNSMIAGLDTNLAQIEGHGLAASDAFRGQYDRLALREGDTEFTRLRKLAEMAQTIESGLSPYLANPRVPQQQKDYIREVMASVRKTIPFTHADVAALEVAPGTVTLQSLIEAKGLDKGSAAPATTLGGQAIPPPNPRGQELPTTNEKGWILLEDGEGNLAYVSPDGTQIEEVK